MLVGEEQEADPAPPAVAEAATRAASEARMTAWARKMTDRVPTGWLISGTGAVLLASTAAFGGLADVPKPKPAELRAGEHFVGSELDMSVVSAAIGGEVRGTSIYPAAGQRTLVVVLDVTNEFDKPRLAATKDALRGIGVEDVALEGFDASRVVDGSNTTFLQPDVPARVRLAWAVDADVVSVGDEIRIVLPDSTHYVGELFTRGDYWSDVRTGAFVTVQVDALPAEQEATP
ncbi:hypothetical protein RS86_00254 [Microbacterium azadirachtae]|uniref:Uncharacterized protein n=1 Tax=Microbacterium azadirachtae TaxID=582680 RepID=A0A0F0LTJ6_9MICO|nr:hypothetical protein RS86_00254 [Microbacterium azadirachtae]